MKTANLDNFIEYSHSLGSAIREEKGVGTYNQNIVDHVTLCFAKLEALVELMKSNESNDVSEIGWLAEEVLEHQKRKITRALGAVEDITGEIELVCSGDDNGSIAKDDVLDVFFIKESPRHQRAHKKILGIEASA